MEAVGSGGAPGKQMGHGTWNRAGVLAVTLLLVVSVAAGVAVHAGALARASASGRSTDRLALAVPSANNPLSANLNINPSQTQEGQSINLQTNVNGGTPPYAYSYTGLPQGCPNQNQSSYMCTPTSTGNYEVSVTVTDAHGNQTVSSSVGLSVTSSNSGNGKGNGNNGSNNSSNPLSSLFSNLGGYLSLVLIAGLIGFVTWVLLVVGVWIIAITLVRRLPKRVPGGPSTVPCPSCSTTMPAGAKFCPECGKSTGPKPT